MTDAAPRQPSEELIRILVVDDQPIIRRGIALILATEDGIEVVGQAADGLEALELVSKHKPHVVLMDLQMPRLGGVATTRRIRTHYPETRVVVLTTFDTDDLVFEAIRAGAHAYLLKDANEAEVLDTIRAAYRGEFRLTANIARKVMESFQSFPFQGTTESVSPVTTASSDAADEDTEISTGPDTLTPREKKVLELVARGWSNKRIAQTIFLAEGTVKNYVSRIMEKLHARTRIELAVKIMQRNL